LGSARRSSWLLGGIAVVAWMSILIGTADGHRQATSGEARGNPDRRVDDLRRIPRRVLEDFFGDGYCA